MMRRLYSWIFVCIACGAVISSAGCGPKPGPAGGGGTATHGAPNTTNPDGTATPVADAPLASPEAQAHAAASPAPSSSIPGIGAAPTEGAAAPQTPVKIEGGTATIGPDNSQIIFIGTHKAPKAPDPRTGGFEKFNGKIVVDEASKTLKSAVVDIDATSVWTEFQKLTDHLKSADFFDSNEFPTAKFESSQIEPGDAPDQVRVRGNLTLHGVTKEITIPATVKVDNGGIVLMSQFDVNRSDFKISYGPNDVDDKVAIKIVVGEKTSPTKGGGK
jgi:polyisoprenoid-binding protein YceI